MCVMKLSSEQASSNDYDLVLNHCQSSTIVFHTLWYTLGVEALPILFLFVHNPKKCVLCTCVFISIASHHEVQLN